MNSEDQQTLCNLRILSKLQKDQWLITDSLLNIVDICDNTFYNNFSLLVRRDSWEATLECLKSIYCDKLPKLVDKLINRKDQGSLQADLDSLKRVLEQLNNSISGLKIIRESYIELDGSNSKQAHLESIENDFANSLQHKIELSLNKN